MATLSRELRRELERKVKEARCEAEAGARKAIDRLGVGDAKPPEGLSPAGRSLRDRLRAHGRQLGDRRDTRSGKQVTARLVAECAYENWHRMLFARFLAENDLLIEPEHGVTISLDDCKELARSQADDWLDLASSFAVRMLPQIFRPGDPVLDVSMPPETRSQLEDLLKALPTEIFKADDSLGWVYQFWQADRKEEVNKSETKIGADELPAVTQLFTEDYMVLFLLHNTLGAWWAGKVLAARPNLATSATSEDELRVACAVGDVTWTYLRFARSDNGPWRPASGTFDGWPKHAREITVLDPCMGSGHFLVFALPILVALRMAEEHLSREAAVDAVLSDNLFGLEIDPRCTQIAAFNLALAIWRVLGYRPLPPLQLACSGLSLGVTKEEWLRLAERISPLPPDKDLFETRHNLFSQQVQGGLEAIYDLFEKAPWLGSLIEPRHAGSSLLQAGYKQLEPLLVPLLATQSSAEVSEMAVTAQGLSKAAEILARRFVLVVTNVPYVGRGKQDQVLMDYCEQEYSDSKADLATCFVERCLAFCEERGTASVVTPQNWLFLGTYEQLRKRLLHSVKWDFVARLGEHAFESPQAAGAFAAMVGLTANKPNAQDEFLGVDASDESSAEAKSLKLMSGDAHRLGQARQIENPDSRIVLANQSSHPLLREYADSFLGLGTGDFPKYGRYFWEFPMVTSNWTFHQCTIDGTIPFGGREHILAWDSDAARVRGMSDAERQQIHNQDQSGQQAWGKRGVAVALMRELRSTLYTGEKYEKALTVLVPHEPEHLPGLWALCNSPEFNVEVRKLDQKIIAANGTVVKIPYDIDRWQRVAAELYPNGLPSPGSRDSTQWLFSGSPSESQRPLQVSVARLVGYCWPRQTGSSFLDCPALEQDGLESHADVDGIVCLASIKGEPAASERVNGLLAAAFRSEWSAGKLDSLLAGVGFARTSLDAWLRDGFFENHCEVFHQRPFVLHIWDGRPDGFHALVNYHRLVAPDGEGRRTLEKLVYTYLGDGWIKRQRDERDRGVDGADGRIAAAEHLKKELEKILKGEPPYDIFVRWKPLHQQPIGWEPDINDGVRINIRPFMTARPLGARAKNACILRVTPRINWRKDLGKEQQRPKDEFPWLWSWDGESQDFAGGAKFDGNRWNGLHYGLAMKQAARDRAAAGAEAEV